MGIGVTILENILIRGRDHVFIIFDITLIVSPISLNSGSFNVTFSFLPVLGAKMQIAVFEVFKTPLMQDLLSIQQIGGYSQQSRIMSEVETL